MSSAATTETTLQDGLGAKVRKTLIGTGFAVVLLVPKILNLRRNESSWTLVRTALGVFGAALVVLPLSIWNNYLFAVVGLAIFITAILLPPAMSGTRTDDKARDLGALIVVNGGLLQPSSKAAVAVQLFVGSDNIWALDEDFHPVLVVAVPEITYVYAEELSSGWTLTLRWADRSAIFSYEGVFAEHLAHVAENTIQSVLRPALPVLPQSRAASA